MKSTGGHSECLCLSLYADLLRCTALIALLCPPAQSTVLLWSSILLVSGVLFTMLSKHHHLDVEDKWQGEVIGFFRGKDKCQF